MRIEQTLGSAVPDVVLAEAETIADIARALVPIRGTAAAAVVPLVRTVAERAAAQHRSLRQRCSMRSTGMQPSNRNARTSCWRIARPKTEPISLVICVERPWRSLPGLKRHGIRPGEAVAIMLPTGREFFAAFYGALYAQAVPVPVPRHGRARSRRTCAGLPEFLPTVRHASCSLSAMPGDWRSCCDR